MDGAADGKGEDACKDPLRKLHACRPFETKLPGATINCRARARKGYCSESRLLRRGFARRIRAAWDLEDMMVDRRGFLSSFAGLAGTAGALNLAREWPALFEQEAPKLPDAALYASDEEAYWGQLRKQFLIPADEVYLNNGTVGSSPMPVLRAIFDGYNETEKMAQKDPEDYPIWR